MSPLSAAFHGILPDPNIGWPEPSMAVVVVRHDTHAFAASLMGYAASAAVLGTFLMNRMVPLRLLAILSNILFVAYGYSEHIYPVLCLHMALLPINLQRLFAAAGVPARIRALLSGPARMAFVSGLSALFVFGVLAGSFGGWVIIRVLGVMHA